MTAARPWLQGWDVTAPTAPLPARPTLSAVKREAHRLRDTARAQGHKRSLSAIYEQLAQDAGHASWAGYRAALRSERTR